MKTVIKFIWLICLLVCKAFAQNQEMKWFNPAKSDIKTLKGKAWQNTDSANYYNRLPANAATLVRKAVWDLAKQTAGEYIDFTTNANKIVVKYQIAGGKSMDNMVALGVSGVDLYAQDAKNVWHWWPAKYSFNDTVTFVHAKVDTTIHVKKYRLYLPLYNTPKWLKIGVANHFDFNVEEANEKSFLVFYGTSIMQGASASRPGLAWLNILGRKLSMPVINLGFSGNGRLEQPLIDLMNQTDAQLFVLDCQPNLHDRKVYTAEEIKKRIVASVESLRQRHPKTPILLVEHSSGLPGISLYTDLTGMYIWTSKILSDTYYQFKKGGDKNLFLLTAKEIGFTDESTIDGTHPTDLGMMQYANAYEKIIGKILVVKK